MGDDTVFLLVNAKALPETFVKVVAAKKLLETGRVASVKQAVYEAGISRSVFYKYRDLVFACGQKLGRTLTVGMNLNHTPGLLSRVLAAVADSGANVLTISQTIPIGGVANVTMTLEAEKEPASDMVLAIGAITGVHSVKIINRE